MNLLHAAHAMGYVGRLADWLARLFAERSLAAFCEADERIAGFIFIGQPAYLVERPRPKLDPVVRHWDRQRSTSLTLPALLYYHSMTLKTQHEKPVYVRLRESSPTPSWRDAMATAMPFPRCAPLPRTKEQIR